MRGLRWQRYAGDASAYGSVELRLFLGHFFFFFPAEWGILGFADAGRVFADGLPSDEWHTSLGGGIWIAPVTRSTTVRISIAKSEGRSALYFGSGFAF